jgi:hypothetical protein
MKLDVPVIKLVFHNGRLLQEYQHYSLVPAMYGKDEFLVQLEDPDLDPDGTVEIVSVMGNRQDYVSVIPYTAED